MATDPKKQKIDNEEIDDDKLAKIMDDIQNIQDELNTINEQASEEILSVERKFNTLREPQYKKRSEAIKQIPDFWSQTIANHPHMSELLNESDIELLQSLKDLIVEEHADIKSGYKVTLHFDNNKFITNKVIERDFIIGEMGELEPKSTKIELKKGVKKEDSIIIQWLEEDSEHAIEIAEIIKDDIWNNPMQYFFGLDNSDDEFEEDDEDVEEESVDEQ